MLDVFASCGESSPPPRHVARRTFLSRLAALPLGVSLLGSVASAAAPTAPARADRERVRAVLLSATTLAGGTSLGHAAEGLTELFGDIDRLLLINFASLPADRDAYAARMQRDFDRLVPGIEVDSLHQVPVGKAADAIRRADAVFVSGGNTFLLLRELYDRFVVELLRERVLGGMPYAGSSAGANLAGRTIGTTNDFPLVDIPTRRALGILPGVFNPHHPDPANEGDFASRQWKIRQYATHHPDEAVIGVTDPGYLQIRGDELTLAGREALATVQLADRSTQVSPGERGNLSNALEALRADSNGGQAS
ncbi:MAG: dipeptidase PepE [Opitutales bacterium]